MHSKRPRTSWCLELTDSSAHFLIVCLLFCSDVLDIVKSIASGSTQTKTEDLPPMLYMHVQPYATLRPQSMDSPQSSVSPHYAAINGCVADRYLATALWQNRIRKLREAPSGNGNSAENQVLSQSPQTELRSHFALRIQPPNVLHIA